jgi:predicted nucleic acid-binding protein
MPSPSNYFLDTNILVYAFDNADPTKQKLALDLIADSKPWQISWQIIQEFCNTALHNRKCQVPANTLDSLVDLLLSPHCTVFPDPSLWQSALRIQTETQYRFYDSLVVASALRSGAPILYSEDLQDGRIIGDMEIRNPFLE